jgi:cytochrome c oxidase subunit II
MYWGPRAMMSFRSLPVLSVVALLTAMMSSPVRAEGANVAQPWQMDFQPAASPVAERLQEFHNLLLPIITAITLFVLALLIYVVVRFNAKANPVPSKTTHNVMLEIIWTVVPVLILIVIAIPSFKLLYYVDRTSTPDMTLKVTGYQWYWGYEYPDQGGINFLANLVPEKEIDKAAGQQRLLSTDNAVVVPVDTNIRVLITASDVIHSFAMPAFGVKTDAIPGRLNETWMRVTKLGTYYGQCSELCGNGHAYMPIEVRAVSKEDFATWVAAKKKEQGIADTTPVESAITPVAPPANTTQSH